MSKTIEDKCRFVELRAGGVSFSNIATHLNVSKTTLIAWSKDETIHRDITNQRALLVDEMQERYAMTKRHRIEVLGGLLSRAKEELSKRDISTLPTGKLVSLVMQLNEALKKEESELELVGEPEMPTFEIMKSTTWKT